MSKIKWFKTAHKGLRYREHETRKHGKKKDRYYSIRFRYSGKSHDYGVGWLSEGVPEAYLQEDPGIGFEEYCLKLLRKYKGNMKNGSGPISPKEHRAIVEEKREQEEIERAQAEKENIAFADFMKDSYLPQCELDKKSKTRNTEESLYNNHLHKKIGHLPFPKISGFHLEQIKKKMTDDKLANRTIQYVLTLVRQVFNTAKREGIFSGECPTASVKWPKLDNMKMRYLTVRESEELLSALAVKSKNLRDISLLSLHAGLRFGEIASLTWSCVNLEAGTLAILNAKTGSRTAYLTKRAKSMLDERKKGKEVRPDELVFPERRKAKGKMDQVSRKFMETVNELKFNEGITDRKQLVTFHTLRHSYATILYESTHDLYLTQRSLGHSTGTMTARYAKMSENRLREGAAELEKAFESNGNKQKDQNIDQAETA